jgi:hypothetical protein
MVQMTNTPTPDEPAFPLQDASAWQYGGMSLRDYFAAKALIAIYPDAVKNGACVHQGWRVGIAIDCYDIADAMLEARTLKRIKP